MSSRRILLRQRTVILQYINAIWKRIPSVTESIKTVLQSVHLKDQFYKHCNSFKYESKETFKQLSKAFLGNGKKIHWKPNHALLSHWLCQTIYKRLKKMQLMLNWEVTYFTPPVNLFNKTFELSLFRLGNNFYRVNYKQSQLLLTKTKSNN